MDTIAGKQFGSLLRDLIHSLRIKDIEFAKRLEIKKQTLSNYVNGKSLPDWSILRDIVSAYRVNPSWLLTGEGEMFQGGSTPEPIAKPLPETTPEPEPAAEKSPLEREMETYERLMIRNGADKSEIREGLKARMGVQPQKKGLYESLREPTDTPPYPGVHESDPDFGEGI